MEREDGGGAVEREDEGAVEREDGGSSGEGGRGEQWSGSTQSLYKTPKESNSRQNGHILSDSQFQLKSTIPWD